MNISQNKIQRFGIQKVLISNPVRNVNAKKPHFGGEGNTAGKEEPPKEKGSGLKKFFMSHREIIICSIALVPCLLFPPLSPLFIALAVLAMWKLDRDEKKIKTKDFQDAFVGGLG